MATNQTFRNKVAFGKRIEAYVKGLMLKQGLDVYTPEVDDDGVHFVAVQVKAVAAGAFFAGISHKARPDYWFVFYSESMDTFWVFSSSEFRLEAKANNQGKNVGKYSIKLNGTKKGVQYTLPKYQKYVATDFSRIIQ